ncbi:uncharacterized protein [Clytia hemisphaerica]|uniref:uncharacterized protein n=1 Tax=Clytia hemisphaerica TaxID=252671 RepID=UPI0034D6FC6D
MKKLLLIYHLWFVFAHAQEMNAKLNSYNLQVTSNTDGSMFKFISPQTDVQNTLLKEPPKVQVKDLNLPTALVMKDLALTLTVNPSMDVEGDLPEYKYTPAKEHPKIYNVVKVLHTHHDVEPIVKEFAKSSGDDNGSGLSDENTHSTKSEISGKKQVNVQSQKENDLFDEDQDSSSGEEESDAVENFPPKAPEIPIELGNKNKKVQQQNSRLNKEGMSTIDEKKKKPCSETTCVEQSKGGGSDENQSDDSEPKPDIPIELGLTEKDSEEDYKTVDIDQKTPESFIMVLNEDESGNKRKRRSAMEAFHQHRHRSIKRKTHQKRQRKRQLRKRQRKNGKSNRKTYVNRNGSKRSEINIVKGKMKSIEHFKQSNPKRKHIIPVEKPIQIYVRTLAKDVQNVMAEAKKVLQNTNQVEHGLKRIVGGASLLSSVATDAMKYSKYFHADTRNSSLEYLQEKAIVALISAQQAAQEAIESAQLAREASNKATDIARRMDIAKTPAKSLLDTALKETVQTEKAAKFAAFQNEKVRNISKFLNTTFKRMTVMMREKPTIINKQLPRQNQSSLVSNNTAPVKPIDLDYKDFGEDSKPVSSSIHKEKPLETVAKKKKDILKPIHLVPGQFTGFKRSRIHPIPVATKSNEVSGESKGGNIQNARSIIVNKVNDKRNQIKNILSNVIPQDLSSPIIQQSQISNNKRSEIINTPIEENTIAIKRFKSIGSQQLVEGDSEPEITLDNTGASITNNGGNQELLRQSPKFTSAPNNQEYIESINDAPLTSGFKVEATILPGKPAMMIPNSSNKNIESQPMQNKSPSKRNSTASTTFDSNASGSGADATEDDGDDIDLSKILKAPISVDVHVSSIKDHGNVESTPDAESENQNDQEAGNNKSEALDPFGFTKDNSLTTSKHEEVVDPFGFNDFQISDRKVNHRDEISMDDSDVKMSTPKRVANLLDWDR